MTTITPSSRLEELAAKCEQWAELSIDYAMRNAVGSGELSIPAIDRALRNYDRAAALRAHAKLKGEE
jgi:hypothetical protein